MIRSKQYPFKDLQWCIDVIKRVSTDYSSFTDKQLAAYLNNQKNNSTTSGDFKKKIGALNHFDLLNKEDDEFVVSQKALYFLFGKSDETNKTLKKIALTPSTFLEAYNELKYLESFKIDDLQNIAINKLGIKPKSFAKFYKNITSTFLYANLIKQASSNEFIIVENNNDLLNTKINDKDKAEEQSQSIIVDEHNTISNHDQSLTIPFLLANGDIKKIIIPHPNTMEEIDIKRLKKLIEMYTDNSKVI